MIRIFRKNTIEERASYMRDFVLSANDGIITTFAVVAGAQGANLAPRVVIILGVANLVADAISMASGSYLSQESEDQIKALSKSFIKHHSNLLKHALITFLSFVIAGIVPLLPFIFSSDNAFYFSVAMVVISLMGLGFARSIAIKKGYVRSILETSIVGSLTAFLAFSVGKLLESLVR